MKCHVYLIDNNHHGEPRRRLVEEDEHRTLLIHYKCRLESPKIGSRDESRRDQEVSKNILVYCGPRNKRSRGPNQSGRARTYKTSQRSWFLKILQRINIQNQTETLVKSSLTDSTSDVTLQQSTTERIGNYLGRSLSKGFAVGSGVVGQYP